MQVFEDLPVPPKPPVLTPSEMKRREIAAKIIQKNWMLAKTKATVASNDYSER